MRCTFVDTILVNNEPIPPDVQNRYTEELAKPVHYDVHKLYELGLEVVHGEIASLEDGVIRHDTKIVAEILYSLLIDETKKRFNA
jgi:2-phospho-L-lactate transferase/gluconeogenesis factor (CofD/UPF0052 family)